METNPVVKKPKKKMSFEETMKELETVVNKLERDDLDLEASITLFQRGVELAGSCGKILEEAEGKIAKLIKETDGKLTEEPFNV